VSPPVVSNVISVKFVLGLPAVEFTMVSAGLFQEGDIVVYSAGTNSYFNGTYTISFIMSATLFAGTTLGDNTQTGSGGQLSI